MSLARTLEQPVGATEPSEVDGLAAWTLAEVQAWVRMHRIPAGAIYVTQDRSHPRGRWREVARYEVDETRDVRDASRVSLDPDQPLRSLRGAAGRLLGRRIPQSEVAELRGVAAPTVTEQEGRGRAVYYSALVETAELLGLRVRITVERIGSSPPPKR